MKSTGKTLLPRHSFDKASTLRQCDRNRVWSDDRIARRTHVAGLHSKHAGMNYSDETYIS